MDDHRARITWLAGSSRGKAALPATLRYIGIGRFVEDGPEWPDGSWSVVCHFELPPAEQANPSIGRVQFLASAAPRERIKAGARFRLYEGPTEVATVEVLE
jgi:hypothetical protein